MFFEGRSLVLLVQSCPFIFSFHILKVGHSERCWLYDELLVKNDGPSFWGFSFVEFKRVTRRESKDWFYPESFFVNACNWSKWETNFHQGTKDFVKCLYFLISEIFSTLNCVYRAEWRRKYSYCLLKVCKINCCP